MQAAVIREKRHVSGRGFVIKATDFESQDGGGNIFYGGGEASSKSAPERPSSAERPSMPAAAATKPRPKGVCAETRLPESMAAKRTEGYNLKRGFFPPRSAFDKVHGLSSAPIVQGLRAESRREIKPPQKRESGMYKNAVKP